MPGTCTATGEWAMAGCGGRAPPAAPFSRPPCSWAATAAGPGRTKRRGAASARAVLPPLLSPLFLSVPFLPSPRGPPCPAPPPARPLPTHLADVGLGPSCEAGGRDADPSAALLPCLPGSSQRPCPCPVSRCRRGGGCSEPPRGGGSRGWAQSAMSGSGSRRRRRRWRLLCGGGGFFRLSSGLAGRSRRRTGPRRQLPPPRAGRAGSGGRAAAGPLSPAVTPPRPPATSRRDLGPLGLCRSALDPRTRCHTGLDPSGAVTVSCPPQARCHSALSPSSTLSRGHVPCRHGVAGPCPTKQRLYLWANSRCTPYPQTQPQHPYLGLPCPRDTLVLSNPVDILWGFGFCDTQRWHLLVSGALLAASLSKGSVDKPNMLWRCSVQFGVGFVSAEGFPTKASPPTAWPRLLQDHPNDHFYLSSPSSTVGSATLDSARSWRGKLQCFKATFFSFMCESPICVA